MVRTNGHVLVRRLRWTGAFHNAIIIPLLRMNIVDGCKRVAEYWGVLSGYSRAQCFERVLLDGVCRGDLIRGEVITANGAEE